MHIVFFAFVRFYRRRLRRTTAAPCLLETPAWPNVGAELGQAIGLWVPQPFWKQFGEHLGEEEGEDQEREEKGEEEASRGPLGPSWDLLAAS